MFVVRARKEQSVQQDLGAQLAGNVEGPTSNLDLVINGIFKISTSCSE